MCQRCKRNNYYQPDYVKQVVYVLNSSLEIVEVLTIPDFVQRILALDKVSEVTEPEFEEDLGDHL